jgi:lysozyme
MKKKFRPSIAIGIPAAVLAGVLAFGSCPRSTREDKPPETIEQTLVPNYQSPILEDKSYSASQDIVDFLKDFEAYREETYLDQGGLPTICYGHLIKPGETFGKMSEESCTDLLKKDLSRFEKAVNDYVSVDLTQNQYDALVSLSFNIGTNAFKNSTLLRKLNQGDYEGAAEQFDVWNKVNKKTSKGLVKRRAKERDIFQDGIYDSSH